MAWSPDGKRLAVTHDDPSASGEHALSLIDAGTWRETMRLVDGERESVDGVAISPDGTIAAGSFNGAARLWDRQGRPTDVLACGHGAGEGGRGRPNGSSGVAFSPDGKRLAALCGDATLRLWSVTDGHARPALDDRDRRAPFGDRVLARWAHVAWGSWDGIVGVTGAAGGNKRQLGRHGKNVVQTLTFDAAGTTLVSGSRDGEVRIWDPGAGTVRSVFKVQGGLSVPAAVSPDGKLIVTGGPGGLAFWDAAKGQRLDRQRSAPEDQSVGALAFRPDGALLAVAATRGIEILDMAAGRRGRQTVVAEIASLGDTGAQAVMFTPGGDGLAAGGVDELRLWNLEQKIPTSVLVEKAAGVGSALDIVVGAGPRPARLVPAPAPPGVHAIDPTGSLAAVPAPGGALTIMAGSRPRLKTPVTGSIGALAFSPDKAAVAVAGENGKVQIVDAATGKKTRQLRSVGRPPIRSRASPSPTKAHASRWAPRGAPSRSGTLRPAKRSERCRSRRATHNRLRFRRTANGWRSA